MSMFRKIIFIIFATLHIEIELKAVLLLSFSFLSVIFILNNRPFVMRNFNMLEFKSNLAVLVSLFFGNFYIFTISNSAKVICFLFIILANTWFFKNFFFSVSILFMNVHFEKIKKYMPKCAEKIAYLLLLFDECIFIDKKTSNMVQSKKKKKKYKSLGSFEQFRRRFKIKSKKASRFQF